VASPAVDGDVAFGVAAEGIGVFSPWGIPDASSQACPGSSCMPTSDPVVPSHARASAARSVGRWEGKVRRRKRIRLTGGAKLP
jgi:hypothetical protein